MTNEAPLAKHDHGSAPKGAGWFVLNARDGVWRENENFGKWVAFEGEPRFEQLGLNIHVLEAGQPACYYHREDQAEAFFVLAGTARVIVEGQERALREHDLFWCPPNTAHVLVGGDDGPCSILMLGARLPGRAIHYPVDATAAKYGASVETPTDNPAEAYANSGERVEIPCPWPEHGPDRG